MDDRPMWRRMFDAWNEQVGTRLEQLVRTSEFADQASVLTELNRRRAEMAAEMTERWLHFWNVPTARDVAALKRQLESLDRELYKVNKTLQEVRDAAERDDHG